MAKKLTKKEKEEIRNIVENEGFEYAFRDYSDFDEIKDEEFHKLRLAFIEAAENLENYIG